METISIIPNDAYAFQIKSKLTVMVKGIQKGFTAIKLTQDIATNSIYVFANTSDTKPMNSYKVAQSFQIKQKLKNIHIKTSQGNLIPVQQIINKPEVDLEKKLHL